MLLEMKAERFMPHTTDDDDRRYRPVDEVKEARRRDPVVTLAAQLVDCGTHLLEDQGGRHQDPSHQIGRRSHRRRLKAAESSRHFHHERPSIRSVRLRANCRSRRY